MTLLELITKVNDKQLSKEQLEAYRDDLANLLAKMYFEIADIEKEEAIYFLEKPEKTDIATKRVWNGTKSGQRKITLKHYIKATETIISSTKSRLYRLYD